MSICVCMCVCVCVCGSEEGWLQRWVGVLMSESTSVWSWPGAYICNLYDRIIGDFPD
jgi:hypothetical protein